MESKVWLITGISSGLGNALAKEVMAANDFLIGTFRKQEQVDLFNKEHKGKAIAFLLDICDHKSMEAVVCEIISNYKRIDVLVNNAGYGFVGAVEETSIEETRAVFESNFFGTLKLTQLVIPYMRKQRSGNVVQISSHGGIKAFAGFGIYNASKFALEGFSEALADELTPFGIKVSIVEPGPFRTKFASNNLGEAALEIDDYATTSGAFKKKLRSVNGQQEGDPEKASKAIITFIENKDTGLRLPLGKTALLTIGMKIKSIQNDLEATSIIAAQAVYE